MLPLDVPELLETLIRQSEPLLETLGVNKGEWECMRIAAKANTWDPVVSSKV